MIPQLCKFHIFSVHLFPKDPVGIFKAQDSESQLVFSDSPGVTRFLCCQIIFPEKQTIIEGHR